MKCATHPNVETNLCCGKCGKPICPKCMVQTPVGARCRECAGVHRLPTYRVSSTYYMRAIGAAIGIAAVTGVIWGFVEAIIPFIYLNWIFGGVVGYACAEVIGLAVNRKRGTGLAVIAGGATVLAYLVAIFVPWGFRFTYFDLIAVGIGIFAAVGRIR